MQRVVMRTALNDAVVPGYILGARLEVCMIHFNVGVINCFNAVKETDGEGF